MRTTKNAVAINIFLALPRRFRLSIILFLKVGFDRYFRGLWIATNYPTSETLCYEYLD